MQKHTSSDNNHIIYHGDSLDILKHHIDDESVDLIFADPPYNIGKKFANSVDKWPSEDDYVKWCYKWIDLCFQKLKPHGSMYLMTSTQAMPYIDIYMRNHWHILSRIIWAYDSSGVQAKKYFGSLYEPILFCVKNKNKYIFNAHDIMVDAKTGSQRKLIDYRKKVPTIYNSTKVPGNVWNIPRVRFKMAEYENHPSQKPEALLERIILASSNKNNVILDPFSGTFTTSAVARKLERKSIGIDMSEEYVNIGISRVFHHTEL